MKNKEFKFEIHEIKSRPNPNIFDGKEDYINITTGFAFVRDGEIDIVIDDSNQPDGVFIATDGFFKKLVRKISEAVK